MNKFLLISAVILVFIACEETENEISGKVTAMATFNTINPSGQNIYDVNGQKSLGTAKFEEENGIVTLTIQLEGFNEEGEHAIHIHNGTCSEPGMHFNHGNQQVYCNKMNMDEKWGRPMAGDIANVTIGSNGEGSLTLKTDFWSLTRDDSTNIVNKVIILHEFGQDFAMECATDHDPMGHPHNNPKIACGKITVQ